MNIRQMLVSSSKYNIKCPYSMNAEYITVHNTANDASANNEVSYMINNNSSTSFHIAVDDKEAVQGIPFNRNAWHSGDGNGNGNRKSIGIEICYSKSGGDRFIQAEKNCAKLVAQLLKERGWGLDRVRTHQSWSGKYCLPIDCTELLTPNGWLNLSDVKVGDIVAQYDDGKISFTNVEDVVTPYESQVSKIYKLEATFDHRMWCKQSGSSHTKWNYKIFGDILNTKTWYNIPHSGQIDNEGLNLSDDMIKFLVWVQGDGHYMKRKYNDGEHYLGIEFHLSKERKINKLLTLLEDIGYKYTKITQTDGTTKIRLFSKKYVDIVEQFLENKEFSFKLLKMNNEQFNIFIDELLEVDGCRSANSYCTTRQKNYDVVQALCSINGIRSNQVKTGSSTSLIFSNSNLSYSGSQDVENRKTLVSCVTVSSGKILIRQYGQPKIVGNCPHRTLDMGWQRFLDMVSAEMGGTPQPSPSKPTCTGDITYQTYDNVKKCFLPSVVNDRDYAGNAGHAIGGIKAMCKNGNIYIQSHVIGKPTNQWEETVTLNSSNYNSNSSNAYSGIKGKNIDCVKIWSDYGYVEYRVAPIGGNYYAWVSSATKTGTESYAGVYGKPIDKLQMK